MNERPAAHHPNDLRVLVLTPHGKDFELAHAVFQQHNIAAVPCSNLGEACSELDIGAGALIVAEEALTQSNALVSWIDRQPPWSDLPILLLARPGVESIGLADFSERLGNVTILERPMRVAALVSAVRSALRARGRQYQIRAHLAARAEAEENLRNNDRRKDEFLATLAHELRNPLAPISNALQILRLTHSSHAQTALFGKMMERQVGNLKRLVEELLDVSRVTRGNVELRVERVELTAILRAAAEASQPLIESSKHQLLWYISPEPIYLQADPVRLAQIFSNILNNAAKYTEAGGHIELSTDREGLSAVVNVVDDGMGIPLGAQARIFDLFAQVEENRNRAQGGLGIGLTLAKRLVELHHGSIEVFSEGAGKGSRFTVRLPALQQVPQTAAPFVESPSINLTDLRVLIADDNRDAADSLGLLLEQFGASVRVSYGGASALQAFDTGRTDVGIIDLGMQDVDGLEVARRIREQASPEDIKLIALTGWGQERDMRATRAAGFDHHMIKPVDLEALLDHLRRTP